MNDKKIIIILKKAKNEKEYHGKQERKLENIESITNKNMNTDISAIRMKISELVNERNNNDKRGKGWERGDIENVIT